MTPEGWTILAIGDFALQVSERAKGAIFPVLTVSKDMGIVLQTEKFGKRIASRDISNYKRVCWGQFVYDPMLLWAGNIGRQRRVQEGVVSPAYTVFECDSEMDPDYLEHFFRRPAMLKKYKKISRGTNVRRQKALFSDFTALRFAFPPIEEQRKIAAILSSVDEAIEATQRVIDQLQVVKKAMMQELLTRGLPGRHTRFKKTEIGVIPADWRVAELREIGTIITGTTPSTNKPEYWNGEYPFVTPGDLSQGPIILGAARSVSGEGATISRRIPLGSIFVTCIGSTIGKCAIAGTKCCTNQQINSLIPNDEMSDRFLFYSMVHAKPQILVRASQTAVPIISKGKFQEIPIAVPPWEEQVAIGNSIFFVDETISANAHVVEKLKIEKEALLSVLLTGEVRVKPDEVAS